MECVFTTQNFDTDVLRSEMPVLVDFYADWCGPCKMFSPIVDEFAEENQGKVKVGKINIDEEPDLAAQFRVMSIPTAMLFENGQVATQYVDEDGDPTMNGEWNINGSSYAIEGITSPDGRVFGKMGHTERIGKELYRNVPGQYEMELFTSAVRYFK